MLWHWPRVLIVAAVLAASLVGGLIAVSTYTSEKSLSVGTVELSVRPFHAGALDLYVPLVDWGVRFHGVRYPARLVVQAQAVDRRSVQEVASGGHFRVGLLRREATHAIASYLQWLAAIATLSALALGLLVALALRTRRGPRLRVTAGVAALGAVLTALSIAFLLAPRGKLDRPVYYAHGPDIPRALQTVEDATRSANNVSEELDTQLVGLARLVTAPANRRALRGLPRVTIASDLHNNILALPALQRAAAGGPVLFPGDITDSGTPLEQGVARRVVGTGHPFVFVSGNHDSDTEIRGLVRAGAIVLTRHGRLLRDGRHGPMVVTVAGMRIAGYDDSKERRASDGYRDRGTGYTDAQKAEFLAWLLPLVGKVDVVMLHEPVLARLAETILRADPPKRPLLIVDGHIHKQYVNAAQRVIEINGGTVGAGGTGNLSDHDPLGLAILTYERDPRFSPLAVDLVQIDPGTGSARAERRRLDEALTPKK
jgi:predicted phosphodiesterase